MCKAFFFLFEDLEGTSRRYLRNGIQYAVEDSGDGSTCLDGRSVSSYLGLVLPSKAFFFLFSFLCSPCNMIAQSQSGTGKTAAFVLALLNRVDKTNEWPQVNVSWRRRLVSRNLILF